MSDGRETAVAVTGSSRGQLPLWLSVALVAPLFLLLGWSYFLPIVRLLAKSVTEPTLGLSHYARLLSEPLYTQIFFRTIWIAVLSTFFALVLAYPVAMLMARHAGRVATIAAVCVMVPLWTSVLVRSYAWIILIERNGIINNWLIGNGIVAQPLRMLYTEGAVLMAMTHVLLPFMVLPDRICAPKRAARVAEGGVEPRGEPVPCVLERHVSSQLARGLRRMPHCLRNGTRILYHARLARRATHPDDRDAD